MTLFENYVFLANQKTWIYELKREIEKKEKER